MIVGCPSCGAEVEFRYDDSLVRVCDHCRAAVVRGDRGVETLGQFADLAPIESPLRLFAEGKYGNAGFQLVGMAQLRHAAGGVWQEWYAKLDGGRWAWLSEAQGRLYFTFERPEITPPSIAMLPPGAQTELAGAPFTVGERGQATYVAARGEIPYRLAPNTQFHFVDLADGRGGFATIDYGNGSEPPTVYLGVQATPAWLQLTGGEAADAPAAPTAGHALACPTCHGALELRAPDTTLSVVCPYCNSLVGVASGTLSVIAKLRDRAHKPEIPLGSKGRFADGELTVVGYVARAAGMQSEWYAFEEYLLYAPAVGYRWLVQSDHHWSYVQPVAPGAVEVAPRGLVATYDGVAFRRFQTAALRVDHVLGEFYWRVQVGETVRGTDFIAPPAMLSVETSRDEQTWSLATYMTRREVDHAFGKPLKLAAPIGVAPNQPYPGGVGRVGALVMAALCAVGVAKCTLSPEERKLAATFSFPAVAQTANVAIDPTLGSVPVVEGSDAGSAGSAGSGSAAAAPTATTTAPPDPPGTVLFSRKFTLDGGHNLEFDLRANVTNNWAYAVIDLINDDTGAVTSFDSNIEYYEGVDGGESWTEGSRTDDQVLGRVPAGTYVLRVEAIHGTGSPLAGATSTVNRGADAYGQGDVSLDVDVRQGVFRWLWFFVFAGAIGTPFALAGWHAYRFRKRRWENSTVIASQDV